VAPHALLFDLDGTIWDSYPWYARILAEEVGQPEVSILDQLRRGQSIVHLLRAYRVSGSRLTHRAAELPLFPGAREALNELDRRGVPKGVVTSLPGRLAEPFLDGLRLSASFLVVVHAGNCHALKPDPRPLLAALDRLGIPAAEDIFYVGDMPSDGRAAARAGLAFAWAAYGYGSSRPPEARVVLQNFGEVLSL
jgi:HAD superfamily hydrolase (TIGR01549 family)